MELQILRSGEREFTLGYDYPGLMTVRDPTISPHLSFPEALYLLHNAKHSGTRILQPSESLLCYAESLNSFSLAASKPSAATPSKPRSAASTKRFSAPKPGTPPLSSLAAESSGSKRS